MTDESAAGEKSFTIRASGGTFWKRSVTVSPECLEIIKSSGKIEASCPLCDAKLVSCNYWESRAWPFGPVSNRKMTLQLRDVNGRLLNLPNNTAAFFYVDNFKASDVQKLAEAIATLRPDILVVLTTLDLSESAAQKLLSTPSGDWKCPHCQGLNPISEQLWKLQQASAANATIVGMVPPTEVPCVHCKAVVKIDDLVPKQKFCFIATAALGSEAGQQLVVLQQFRDVFLHRTRLGRLFIAGYYRISPPIAEVISRHPRFRVLVRDWLVLPAIATASKLNLSDNGRK
jgi:hypothetical protein